MLDVSMLDTPFNAIVPDRMMLLLLPAAPSVAPPAPKVMVLFVNAPAPKLTVLVTATAPASTRTPFDAVAAAMAPLINVSVLALGMARLVPSSNPPELTVAPPSRKMPPEKLAPPGTPMEMVPAVAVVVPAANWTVGAAT